MDYLNCGCGGGGAGKEGGREWLDVRADWNRAYSHGGEQGATPLGMGSYYCQRNKANPGWK